MKLQKLTAGLLALSMVGAPLPAAAPMLTVCAADETPTEGTCGENLTWKFDESTGTLTISGEGRMYDHPMAFAGIYDMSTETTGFPEILVKGDEVTSVVIEEGVTYLGNFWFYAMENLTSVTLPLSLRRVSPISVISGSTLWRT